MEVQGHLGGHGKGCCRLQGDRYGSLQALDGVLMVVKNVQLRRRRGKHIHQSYRCVPRDHLHLRRRRRGVAFRGI